MPKKISNKKKLEQEQLELARKGRKIITIIVVLDICYALYSSSIDYSVLALLFNLTISFCLYFRFTFARYLYIFNSGFLSLLLAFGYKSFIDYGGPTYLIFMSLIALWYLFSAYLLLKNKAIIAFFNYKTKE